MRNIFAFWFAFVFLSACVSAPKNLSGEIASTGPAQQGFGPQIGLVADSQLQTRANFAKIRGYRGVLEDKASGNVSIRPPALDWAARAMLQYDLKLLVAGGAKAVFYLGDGANNGCYDEFAAGYGDGTNPEFNDEGILRLLADFRQETGIPVFFVIGNHDLLGAGSTGDADLRKRFCANVAAAKPSLLKSDIIALVDRFNRESAQASNAWSYTSSYDASQIERDCAGNESFQHRRWGCYLAAKLNYTEQGSSIQYLLLDTTDFASVSPSEIVGIQQEGLRGAMSFGERVGESTPSQTSWFDSNASEPVAVRIALSHYNLVKLSKNLELLRLSKKVQRFGDIFLDSDDPQEAIQGDAYLISAHTHFPKTTVEPITLKLKCNAFACRPFGPRVQFKELNIGSTTDFSSYAVLAQLAKGPKFRYDLHYSRVDSEPPSCADVYSELMDFPFKRKFLGVHDKGWQAVGIMDDPVSYRSYEYENLEALWANLEQFAGDDIRRATCIGLYSAAVEAKKDPLQRMPPR